MGGALNTNMAEGHGRIWGHGQVDTDGQFLCVLCNVHLCPRVFRYFGEYINKFFLVFLHKVIICTFKTFTCSLLYVFFNLHELLFRLKDVFIKIPGFLQYVSNIKLIHNNKDSLKISIIFNEVIYIVIKIIAIIKTMLTNFY